MTQALTILANGFDIDNLDSPIEETLFKVVVTSDIDGNDKQGFFITSKNSNEYQDATRTVRIEGLKRSAKRKNQLDTSTDEGAGVVSRMIETNELALACSVVKGWFGFTQGGVEAPFTATIVPKMLSKFPTWKDKISAALEVETNFTKG